MCGRTIIVERCIGKKVFMVLVTTSLENSRGSYQPRKQPFLQGVSLSKPLDFWGGPASSRFGGGLKIFYCPHA